MGFTAIFGRFESGLSFTLVMHIPITLQDAIMNRKKTGFNIPVAQWFIPNWNDTKHFSNVIYDSFLSKNLLL